jgi:hypothetical protein
MHRTLPVIAAIACTCLSAQEGDPMATPECVAARQQLEEALAAPVARERLAAVRRQAALVCLGRKAPPAPTGRFDELRTGRFDELRTGRFVPPPVAVVPIPVPPSPAVPPLAALPPLSIPRAPAITSCDAAGCWDSNGQRHNAQGPVLVGPRGTCTVQAGLLNCP